MKRPFAFDSERELLDHLEWHRWQTLELKRDRAPQAHLDFLMHTIGDIRAELERRESLRRQFPNDPMTPRRPTSLANLRLRTEAIKRAFPIDRFLEDHLLAELTRVTPDQAICQCVYPDHRDSSPSMRVYTDQGSYFCFGCQRGGDIITLGQLWLGNTTFRETLDTLEALARARGYLTGQVAA